LNWFALGLVAGLLGIALGACTKAQDDDGTSSNGSGGAAPTSNSTGKGGATATTTSARGGATTSATTTFVPSSGGATGTTAEPCPDLLNTLNPGEAGVCSTSKVAAKFSQINMLIVLDKSGSMNTTPDGYTKTKWAGAVDSLAKALKPGETLIKYGLMLFPYGSSGVASCELADGEAAVNIGVGPAATTVPQINGLMTAPTTAPKGGTPTAAALDSALKYYTIGAGAVLEGPKYVLLVTDGGPNCNPDVVCGPETCTANMDKSPTSCGAGVPNCCAASVGTAGGPNPQALCLDDSSVVVKIQALRNAGIKTFVVGIPGTEQYSAYLDTFAVEGGVPVTDTTKPKKYYEVTGESGLLETFNTITTSLVRSCTVPLEEAPKDFSNINVAIDCIPVPQLTAGTPNWHYDASTQSIVIEGGQCARIESTGVNRVDIVLGCVPYSIN